MKINQNEHVSKMRTSLKEYIESGKKSQVQASRELGISKTTLSLFLADAYTGNNQEIAYKIEQLLAMGTVRQALAKEPDTCLKLSNTIEILDKAYIAHASNDISLIYGPAGCGKSTALKHYAQHNNGVIYVEADVTNSSHRSILILIADAIGEEIRGATSRVMNRLVSKLKGTNQLIIIDEAQHLTPKSFDALRALNDKANIGIVYAGNSSILKRMYGSRQDEYDQVYSRIGYQCQLANRYSIEDIQHIFSQFHLNSECLKLLQRLSCQKGGLRLMVKQYKIATNLANSCDSSLTVDHLIQAGKMMGIGGAA